MFISIYRVMGYLLIILFWELLFILIVLLCFDRFKGCGIVGLSYRMYKSCRLVYL